MLNALRLQIASKMLDWGRCLSHLSADMGGLRERLTILIFFHGYSLAHTIRPLVIARTLRARGFHVVFAGRGPHAVRVRQEGFVVHDVETLPQSRMDQYVSLGDYAFYDLEWIDRCVRSERLLMQKIEPDLVIHDMKPTVSLSACLEGIDDARVTQAYNQPGYPEPVRLMERFGIASGPFDEYLVPRAAEVKEQRSFFLMADIPEFHPPGKGASGYHYVGPLLDRPPAPEHLEILDEGWDTSCPLIYLTCGSSGRSPDYLDELIELVRDKPYRLFITTAGRWSGTTLPDNVRSVDFLPGEWVLQRARVLVGVVGIGAIYQALYCGVPIIGAPEHLDQEYHLNRVQVLGAGVKLQRRSFDAEGILRALEHVLKNYQKFQSGCAPFAGYLEKWDGGKVVGDLVHSHFKMRRATYRVEGPYQVEEGEFLRYLDTTTPETLSKEDLRDILRENINRDLPHRWQDGKLYFDHLDSWNWLYDHEPRFFEADYRALEGKRRRFFVQEGQKIRSRSAWQRYRVNYRFRLLPQGLHPGQRVKLFLPYPITRENHQEDVHLLSAKPVEMGDCFAPSLGFFYGQTFTIDEVDEPRDFGYVCELRVREQSMDGGVVIPSEKENHHYLELEPGLLERPEVVKFRQAMRGWEGENDEERARAIYQVLVHSKRFKKTKDRTQNQTYSTVAVLNDEGGHCITLSRAFIALCRAEGIPAREVTGALIGYPLGENRYAMRNYGEGIFGHTWVEIFLESRGWVPVEFHGIVIGERAMTEKNVKDPAVRALIKENSAKFFDYYFGHVDNQRLICSNSVKRIPECLVEQLEFSPGDRKRWQRPEDLKFECSLNVECI